MSEDAQGQKLFAVALRAADLGVPEGLSAKSAHRFDVYRNNVAVRLIEALEANFPAVRNAVGAEFFAGLARAFIAEHPPKEPMLAFYGAELPMFLRHFSPAAEVSYLADLAQIEICRTQADYAADVEPLPGEALTSLTSETLAQIHIDLHPSLNVVSSLHPIATIWEINAGLLPIAAIEDWHCENVVIARPWRDVEMRRLAPGGDIFLRALSRGESLVGAAAEGIAATAEFDFAVNLACIFNFGLVARLSCKRQEG